MKEQRSKLQQHQEEESKQIHHSTQESDTLEFSSAEELIRHDATQVKSPEAVANRLKASVRADPAIGKRPWWKRLFGA